MTQISASSVTSSLDIASMTSALAKQALSEPDTTPAPSAEHFLVSFVKTGSNDDLVSALKELPLSDSVGQYVIVALSILNTPGLTAEASSLHSGDSFRVLGDVLGDEGMFDIKCCVPYKDYGNVRVYKWLEPTDGLASADLMTPSSDLNSVSSMKLTEADALTVFALANLRKVYSLPLESSPSDANAIKTLFVLEKPTFVFSPLTEQNPFGLPKMEEWRQLWSAWDTVTLGMIPPSMLHQKPIDLRHRCLFYIGHIPTFLDMLLSNLLKEPNTEPKDYTMIFERGIDPHVDDPDHCHRHSVVPEKDEDWPSLAEILAFRDRVRARLMRLYDDIDSGKRKINRRIVRVLQMTLEHEGFHIETILYMLIQKAGRGTLPPPGFTLPPWAALAKQWETNPPPSTTSITLGPEKFVMGHDDSESDDLKPEFTDDVFTHEYGWDNESPARIVDVEKFKIDWRPITNGQFMDFWKGEGEKKVAMPASWIEQDGEILVLTLHEPVPFAVAKHWPVLTSYDDMLIYAQSKGGRIPTEVELRLFLDKYQIGYDEGANVGFRNWHPVPATAGLSQNGGRGSNGGVWEWTSTLFNEHPGLVPTSIFPGYSSDFFDGKHQVVIGASYATIPRLGRRTVRNFYQHNYPYPWVGARVAYDC